MTECNTLGSVAKQPSCNYMPPKILFILVRYTKAGNMQVRINGKGKWIGATYDPVTQKISFSA